MIPNTNVYLSMLEKETLEMGRGEFLGHKGVWVHNKYLINTFFAFDVSSVLL